MKSRFRVSVCRLEKIFIVRLFCLSLIFSNFFSSVLFFLKQSKVVLFLNQYFEVFVFLNISVFFIELIVYNWKFGVFLVYLSAGGVCACEVENLGLFMLLIDSKYIECVKFIQRFGRVNIEIRLCFFFLRQSGDNIVCFFFKQFWQLIDYFNKFILWVESKCIIELQSFVVVVFLQCYIFV